MAIQKGGSFKTSVVSNLGAAIAAKGKRVLLIDADQQGNLTQDDLGVPDEQWDKGNSLAAAFQYGGELTVIKNVRPNLDLVMGGPRIGMVSTAVAAAAEDPPDMAENLRGALVKLQAEGQYDLIVIDSGHGDKVLMIALLEVSTDLIIPTQEDSASLRGIA
ncbi:ParA family protein, partial [Mycobacteroides abscessus]